jgi:hypothetical protein
LLALLLAPLFTVKAGRLIENLRPLIGAREVGAHAKSDKMHFNIKFGTLLR